jgi:hypothetical protein
VLNALFNEDHDPHWEPKNWDRFIYRGRSYGARFLVSDISSAMHNPGEFAAGRVAPGPIALTEGLYGRDLRTGARKEVWIETDNPAFRTVQIMAKDSASWLVPVGAEGFLPGAPAREQTKVSQASQSLLGIGSRKYTAQTQMYDAAAGFNRGSSDAKANLFQKTRDSDAKMESQYRKLDDLLDAGDMDGAKKEYKALIAEGHTAQNIATRYNGIFRPFTGSAARERTFKASLSTEQLKTYNEAIQERKARRDQFNKIR